MLPSSAITDPTHHRLQRSVRREHPVGTRFGPYEIAGSLGLGDELGSPPQITVVPLTDDRTPRPLDTAGYAQGSPKFSPDGRWLAYCSAESGKPQVYIQAFPGPGARIQVSSDGGTDPVWKRDGDELFYRSGEKMMSVPIDVRTTAVAGRPRELWAGRYSHGMSTSCGAPGATSSNFDVTPDGNRFLMSEMRIRTSRCPIRSSSP
jgi:hypothetical protein